MKFVQLIVLTVCLAVTSCTKDVGTDPNITKLVIGNVSGIKITSYDHAASADMDGDGIVDVILTTEQVKIFGPIYGKRITLISSNENLTFRGSVKTDTLFLNRSTSYGSTKINDTITQLYKIIKVTHSCQPISKDDKIESIKPDQVKLRFYSQGESVRSGEKYVSGNFIIADGSNWAQYSPVGAWPDTVTSFKEIFNQDCFSGLSSSHTYLCFTIPAKKGKKIGWIKMSTSPVSIVETAISQ